MSNQIYSITGRVVDKNTGQGIPNLRVEAWDLNQDHQGALGSSNVDENGRFILCLDLKNMERKDPPNLFFKVKRGSEILASTEDSVVLKSGEDKEVFIELNIVKAHPEGNDRLSTKQLFTGVDFLSKSDFKGLFSQTKKKAGTRVGFITDMIMNTVKSSELKPINVENTREQDMINQPVELVTTKLTRQNIIVNDVLPYSPKLDKESLVTLSGAPPRLRDGQKINLYEENGKVRYYSIVKEKEAANLDTAEFTRMHTEELAKVQEELTLTRENAANKDAEIFEITKEHKELLNRMNEELNLAKENEAKKNEEISRINSEHKDQLTQLQQDLKASGEVAARRETEFNQLQQDFKSLKTDQADIMSLLKSKNFEKPTIDVNAPKIKNTDTFIDKGQPPQ